MPTKTQLAPLERTKGLPVDASEKMPDALIAKWQSEKVDGNEHVPLQIVREIAALKA